MAVESSLATVVRRFKASSSSNGHCLIAPLLHCPIAGVVDGTMEPHLPPLVSEVLWLNPGPHRLRCHFSGSWRLWWRCHRVGLLWVPGWAIHAACRGRDE